MIKKHLAVCLILLLAVFAFNPANAQIFSNPAPILMPGAGTGPGPGSPYPSTINVVGFVGNITNLSIALFGMTHTFPGDLDIIIVGPTGIAVYLMSDAGGTSDLVGVNYTFHDFFAPLSSGGPNPSGAYAPTNLGGADVFPAPAPAGPYGTLLSAFNGTSPNGIWSLYLQDDAGGDSGTMAGGWQLQFNGSAIPEPTTYALLAGGGLLFGLMAWKRRAVRA